VLLHWKQSVLLPKIARAYLAPVTWGPHRARFVLAGVLQPVPGFGSQESIGCRDGDACQADCGANAHDFPPTDGSGLVSFRAARCSSI